MTQSSRRLAIIAAAGASLTALRRWRRRSRRIDFAGKTVVISGASRGLGLELARQFAYEGANLVLLARDEGAIVLDLGDASGRAVLIRPGTWEIVDRSPVLFRRTAA